MPIIKMIVDYAHIRHRPTPTLDRDIVIAIANVRLRHRNILRRPRIDAVRIVRPLRRINLQPPHRKSIPVAIGHMKERGVLQSDPVQREVVAMVHHNQPRNLLMPLRLRSIAQVPPRLVVFFSIANHLRSAAAIDHAIAHDPRVRRILA